MARLNRVCPQLPAADVSEAARWYRDKLGFTIDRFYPEHGFAIVRRDDIDGLHATLAGANDGGRLSEVADRVWGMREFYVTDPDGNLLKFGVPASATVE